MVYPCLFKKVREGSANPDYSRPPPGYLPTGQRLGTVGALQSSSVSGGSQHEPSGSAHHPVELPKPHHQAQLSATEELPYDQSASVVSALNIQKCSTPKMGLFCNFCFRRSF